MTNNSSNHLLTNTKAPKNDMVLVESQGVRAIKADTARHLFGVDGTNVTVGVISDSFDNLNGAESDIASGDLPSTVKVLQDAQVSGLLGSDEGRAIMQLVHDVAPGTNLIFHTAGTSSDEYADAIHKLADAGADIIVSDILRPDEPMFQAGIIAQAVNEISSRPGDSAVAYFAAAGNSDSRSYESAFNYSGVIEPTQGGEFHDFNPGNKVDTFQSITLPSGAGISLAFQWDSPFFSISGDGSPNDLDIFLLDSSGTKVLASSTESNIGKDPVEILSFINEEPTTEFNLAISIKDGSAPHLMKYVVFGGGREFKINEFDTASSTIFGNPNAEGAVAVGAASYLETPAFGTEPAQLRFFSSTGGTPVLFDSEGDRLLNPKYRERPNFVAPDGGNTTFFGEDIPEDSDDFPNFPGTSASVAYAGGIAALLLDANPHLTPDEIYSIMEASALDMDDPRTPEFDEGFDYASGYGLLQADRALSLLTTSFLDQYCASDALAIANSQEYLGWC